MSQTETPPPAQQGRNRRFDGWFVGAGVLAIVAIALWYTWDNGVQSDQAQRLSGQTVGEVSDVAPMADRSEWCTSVSGTLEERVDACTREQPAFELSSKVTARIEKLSEKGKVFVVGAPIRTGVEEDQFSASPHRPILIGTDEAAAAKALRDDDYRVVVVHRDYTRALDRDRVVLSRLANHDELLWFDLQYVTQTAMVYTVRKSAVTITLGTGEKLLAGLRARLEGKPVPAQAWDPDGVRLIGTIRLQGQSLAIRYVQSGKLEKALDDLAGKLRTRWDREVSTQGLGRLRDRLDEVRLEVQVVMEHAPVEPRSRYQLFTLWELGVDGAMFRRNDDPEDRDSKFIVMPGSEAVARAFRSPDDFLQHTAKLGGWRDQRPFEDSSTLLDIVRTQHFMERRPGGGRAVKMVRGMPEVDMAELTDENLRQMLVDGGEWWLRNQLKDDSFVYKYWPEQNRYSNDYNEVRHILGARDLADTYRYRKDPRYLEGSKRSMRWLLKYEVKPDDPLNEDMPNPPRDTILFRYPMRRGEIPGKDPNQKLGTVAVGLLGWIAWAKASGDHSEDDRIRKMAAYTLSQAEDSGRFIPYNVPRQHPYYNSRNDIVPGEAALALGQTADYFNEPQWVDFYPKFIDWYQPWFEERAVRKRPTGRWPADTYTNQDRLDLVQFGPWSVMAAAQYYSITKDARAADFGLVVADWMIDNYQWSQERAAFSDYTGGYYKMPTELPAMQTFCYSEGTAAAYRLATMYKPERKGRYDKATREALRFLRVMQYDDVDNYFAAEPELIHGGVRYAMNENKIRTDYVGHGLSTVSQYLDARAEDPEFGLHLRDLDPKVDPPRIREGGADTGPVPLEGTTAGDPERVGGEDEGGE